MSQQETDLATAVRLRDQLAKETLEGIPRRNGQIGCLLDHIRENLFDPELTPSSAKRACGIPSGSVFNRFRRAMKMTTRDYVESLRMQVAEKMLLGSNLPRILIAEVCGYEVEKTFDRAFRRFRGIGADVYRKKYAASALCPRLRQELQIEGKGIDDGMDHMRELSAELLRAVDYGFTPDEAENVARSLAELSDHLTTILANWKADQVDDFPAKIARFEIGRMRNRREYDRLNRMARYLQTRAMMGGAEQRVA